MFSANQFPTQVAIIIEVASLLWLRANLILGLFRPIQDQVQGLLSVPYLSHSSPSFSRAKEHSTMVQG